MRTIFKMTRSRILLSGVTLGLLCCTFAIPKAYAQNAVEGGVKAVGDGIGSIFGAIGALLSPRVTEIKDLHTAGKSDEAIHILFRDRANFFDTDLKELRALLKPAMQKRYQDQVLSPLVSVEIAPSPESLEQSAKTISSVLSARDSMREKLRFFDIEESSQVDSAISNWGKQFGELLESNHKVGGRDISTASSAVRELAGLSSDLILDRCTTLVTESINPKTLSVCESVLSVDKLKPLKQAVTDARIKEATTKVSSAGTYEKIVGLHTIATTLNLDGVDWRNKIEPLLPKIRSMQASEYRGVRGTDATQDISVIRVRLDVTQRVEKQKRTASFVSGSQTLPNPDYLNAQRNYQEAMIARGQCNQQYAIDRLTNPYAINLCWMLNGRINEANGYLSSLSPTVTNELRTPYEFEVSMVTVSLKERVLLVMYSSEKKGTTFLTFEETRKSSFEFARGIHPNDNRTSQSSFASEGAIQSFINDAPNFESREIFDRIVKGSVETDEKKLRNSLLLVSSEAPRSAKPEQRAQTGNAKQAKRLDQMMSDSIVVVYSRDGLGTGFYIRDKFILTNQHVVSGQSLVEIENRSGEKITGIVLAQDEILDLALVAVPKKGIPIRLSRVEPDLGEEAIALGHPKGLKFSVTKGIVSAIRRVKVGPGGAFSNVYVQTDVPINPGNSGGPLVVEGQVVGVNTFKRTESEGLGFALTSAEVEKWLKKNLPAN